MGKVVEIKDISGLDCAIDKIWYCCTGEVAPDFFSGRIQDLIGRDYSHSAWIYFSLDTCDFVVTNCTGKAVQLDNIGQLLSEGTVIRRIFEIKVTPEQRAAFCHKVVELDGTPYSRTRQLLWLAIAYKLRLTWSPFEDADASMWCSEFSDEMAHTINLPKSAAYKRGGARCHVTPRDNVECFEKLCIAEAGRVREITDLLK